MKLKRCPGCLETYDPALPRVAKMLEVNIELERFIAPDGTEYCCADCFEVNGGQAGRTETDL